MRCAWCDDADVDNDTGEGILCGGCIERQRITRVEVVLDPVLPNVRAVRVSRRVSSDREDGTYFETYLAHADDGTIQLEDAEFHSWPPRVRWA